MGSRVWRHTRAYLEVHGTSYIRIHGLRTLLVPPLNNLIGVTPITNFLITPAIKSHTEEDGHPALMALESCGLVFG